MNSILAVNTREHFPPQPQIIPPATTVTRMETQAGRTAGKLPMELLATSPFGDTDFRKKIGIERWGWGLND